MKTKISHQNCLSSLKPGEKGVIESLKTPTTVSLKLMEMGIGPGETVRFVRQLPFGGPIELELMNSRLAIRQAEAEQIVLSSPNATN